MPILPIIANLLLRLEWLIDVLELIGMGFIAIAVAIISFITVIDMITGKGRA